MIIWHVVPGLFLAASISVHAATLELPFLKVGPITYSNVTVIGANATDLYFNHAQGIGNAKLKYLSPELQKRFNYDSAKAADAERKQAEADALYGGKVASGTATRGTPTNAARAAEDEPRDTLANPISEKSLIGRPGPPLAVDGWSGEKPEMEGKYVLVAFWEPWSKACARSLPALNALQKQFANTLVVVGVSTNSETELAQTDAAKPGFPVATDSKGKLCAAAGVTSIPSVLLLDPKGIVRYEGHPAALTEKDLKDLMAAPE